LHLPRPDAGQMITMIARKLQANGAAANYKYRANLYNPGYAFVAPGLAGFQRN